MSAEYDKREEEFIRRATTHKGKTIDKSGLFCSLFDLLSADASVAVLATAIEKGQIFRFDRFGRYGLASDSDKGIALDLIAEARVERLNLATAEEWSDMWMNNYDKLQIRPGLHDFGWFPADLPNLDEILSGIDLRELPQRKGADTRSRDTLLSIINAMADQVGVDPTERGSAARIAEWTERAGTPVGDETVKKYLDMIPDAIERRSK